MKSSNGRYYRPELDALRFFAFLAVFIFHTFPPNQDYYAARNLPIPWLFASISRAGSFGVDLFFALSAYLITGLLLREREQFQNVNLKAFYIRRILRIWPLYFFAIGIAVLLAFFTSDQHFPLAYVVAFLFLSGNWMTSLVGFPGSVMNPLWSVSFEEQFYLIWPIAVSRLEARTLIRISFLMVFVASIGRYLLFQYARHSEVTLFTNSISRLDPLAVGIAIAVFLHRKELCLSTRSRIVILSTGILVWLAAGHFFGLTLEFALAGYPTMAIGAGLILLSVIGIGRSPFVLTYLGKISYGLYVFHMLALYMAEKITGGYAKNLPRFGEYLLLGFVLTVFMAAISYQLLERPFLTLKEKFAFVKSRPV